MKQCVFGGGNSAALSREVAQALSSEKGELRVKRFPDGELNLRFMKSVKEKNVVVINSLHPNPQEAFVELLFACLGARQQGAKKVIVVIPYLGFMRQDKMFHTGEVISSRAMGSVLSKVADKIITIDPHLHRHSSLAEIFSIPTIRLSATKLISDYITKNLPHAVVIGPDEESDQWANEVAKLARSKVVVVKKKRYTADKVRIKIKEKDFKRKTVVIVDDIISTGHTMHEVVKQVKRKGAKKIICLGVHGVFSKGAFQRLTQAGAEVITTNTIQNQVSAISVAKLIVGALR